MAPNLLDEIDCGNFFDQIDDLIDFPTDSNGGNFASIDDCKYFPETWSDAYPDNDSLFSSSHISSSSDLSAEPILYEDIVQLEWLSTFVEDSFSGAGMMIGKENVQVNKEPPMLYQFKTSSPVSELESSSSSSNSSCYGEQVTALGPTCGPQRARSKRPRPLTFNPRAAVELISPTSPFILTNNAPLDDPGLPSDSNNLVKLPPPKIQKPAAGEEQKKKKKIKASPPASDPMATSNHNLLTVRKCLHCEITQTPQWRAGPMGPKTLCNACGVRHKSGRLFPEYRPAASPTFIPAVHSNSHKKVLEMRGKVGSATTLTIQS